MSLPASADLPLRVQSERPQDAPAVEALLDHAFGPGRFVKSSERVREIARFRPDLSFCAFEGERLVGTVRQHQARVGATPLIFLGPLAVWSDTRKSGVGGLLVARACHAAQAAGERAILLVGDEPYFGRFGFRAAPARAIVMPGPVDPRRVLLRALAQGGAEGFAGAVGSA
jgi:predicted N-acetyltransferase YhbS